jgi:FkbM family methyltransferase
MPVGRRTQEKPEAIRSSWPLDGKSGTELHPIHLGRFNTLEGAQVLRLDDWAAQEQPPKVDFVQMDVDGYEIDVIEGAGETRSRDKPVIMNVIQEAR